MDKQESIIKKQLGNKWEHLHFNIRERFATDPAKDEIRSYYGLIDVKASRAGRLFAYLTRMIKNPLTPYQGQAIPLEVQVFRANGNQNAICWRRIYHFPGKKPYTVSSVKKAGAKNNEMLECVGGGFGMVLNVYTEQEALHFKSLYYFWEYKCLRIRLPDLITPGQTHVIHQDEGNGNFRFTITMRHPVLKQTFFQSGSFRRREE